MRIAANDAERWAHIYRIRFRKSIQSGYALNVEAIAFQLEIVDEFDVVRNYLIEPERFLIELLSCDDVTVGNIHGIESVACITKVVAGKTSISCRISIQEHDINLSKYYQLSITYDSADTSTCIVPLQSDYFQFWFHSLKSTEGNTTKLRQSSTLCTNFRSVKFEANGISQSCSIKEDYGATIGSHLYDSSFILCKFLLSREVQLHPIPGEFVTTRTMYFQRYDGIVELGAGCGLTSWMCAKIKALSLPNETVSCKSSESCHISQPTLYATDRKSQMPLLSYNMKRNDAENLVNIIELDWCHHKQVQSFLSNFTGDEQILLLAADVLYDRDAATSLRALIQVLLRYFSKCEVLLVYKNRNQLLDEEVLARVTAWCQNLETGKSQNSPHAIMPSVSPSLSCEMLYQEANVYIYSIFM